MIILRFRSQFCDVESIPIHYQTISLSLRAQTHAISKNIYMLRQFGPLLACQTVFSSRQTLKSSYHCLGKSYWRHNIVIRCHAPAIWWDKDNSYQASLVRKHINSMNWMYCSYQ